MPRRASVHAIVRALALEFVMDLNRTEAPEAGLLGSYVANIAACQIGVVAVLRLRQAGCARSLEQSASVEPVDPFEDVDLDRLATAPRSAAMNDLGFEQADHRLGEGVVVAVADVADRRNDAGLGGCSPSEALDAYRIAALNSDVATTG